MSVGLLSIQVRIDPIKYLYVCEAHVLLNVGRYDELTYEFFTGWVFEFFEILTPKPTDAPSAVLRWGIR